MHEPRDSRLATAKLCIVIVCCGLALAGCKPQPKPQAAAPHSWPLAYVQLPAGATEVPATKADPRWGGVEPLTSSYGIKGTTYSRYFTSPDSWEALKAAVESELLASGQPFLTSDSVKNVISMYSTPDGRITVSLRGINSSTGLMALSIGQLDSVPPEAPAWRKLTK